MIEYRIRRNGYFDYFDISRTQRFTGKIDINGIKIFEGDIVALHLAANHHIINSPKFEETLGKYEVLWSDRHCAFKLKVIKKNWFDSSFRTEEEMKRETIDWEICPGIIINENYLSNYGSLEVIGSIYDNN